MPHFRKVERAKSVIQNGVELLFKKCSKCKTEFYGTADQTKCDAYRSKKKR
jgi:hypothetical protein